MKNCLNDSSVNQYCLKNIVPKTLNPYLIVISMGEIPLCLKSFVPF